jgi:hypothetical protein
MRAGITIPVKDKAAALDTFLGRFPLLFILHFPVALPLLFGYHFRMILVFLVRIN